MITTSGIIRLTMEDAKLDALFVASEFNERNRNTGLVITPKVRTMKKDGMTVYTGYMEARAEKATP